MDSLRTGKHDPAVKLFGGAKDSLGRFAPGRPGRHDRRFPQNHAGGGSKLHRGGMLCQRGQGQGLRPNDAHFANEPMRSGSAEGPVNSNQRRGFVQYTTGHKNYDPLKSSPGKNPPTRRVKGPGLPPAGSAWPPHCLRPGTGRRCRIVCRSGPGRASGLRAPGCRWLRSGAPGRRLLRGR